MLFQKNHITMPINGQLYFLSKEKKKREETNYHMESYISHVLTFWLITEISQIGKVIL